MRRAGALWMAAWVLGGCGWGSLGAAGKAEALPQMKEQPGTITAAARPVLADELSRLMGAVAGAVRHPKAKLGATVTATREISPDVRAGIQARLAEAKTYLERGAQEQFADSLSQAFILIYYPHESNSLQCRLWKANRDQVEASVENGITLMRHLQETLAKR